MNIQNLIKKSAIRKRSKTSGVIITQYLVNMPEGKSTPDFQCKPVAVTIEKGKLAVFKAVVTGDPKPDVSWRRAKGTLSDKEKFQTKYDESTEEHILEIHKVSVAETDTYKCFAANEYGKAVCTTTLTVTEGKTSSTNPADFRKLLKKSKVAADGESDEMFWDAMLKADRNDYERICSEFGSFFLLKSVGRTTNFSVDGLMQKDTELFSKVDFVIKIQEIKAEEREDALFECVLTHPLPNITWTGKGNILEDGEKYNLTMSDHKLIHRLLIKDCQMLDKGIYSAVVGNISCNAWLIVEADSNPAPGGERRPRKTTVARGAPTDIEKVAQEQQLKIQGEMEKLLAAVNAKYGAGHITDKLSLEELTLEELTLILSTGGKHSQVTGQDPGVQFICGLTDVSAIINEIAELTCKLSSEDCEGVWFRDGKQIFQDESFSITKDGPIHKLVISKCTEEHSGKYRFEADGRKTEAIINVKDPPRFDLEDLSAFTEPKTVKVGHNAIFKLHFLGHKPIKIQWFREGEELQDDNNTRIEKSASHSRLLLSRCQRKDMGEIKIKLKNEHGFTEALSQLIVLDKPTPPLGPAEVTESSATCIEFRWRPPKDDGGSPVINYIMERQQVGRNTWKKIGEIPGVSSYRDTGVERGRKYCYRIRAVTAEGTSEVMETEEMQAGTLAFPGPPAPPKVVSAFDDCINLSWAPPSNTGGSRILGYILEKRKKGSNLWSVVNANDELIKEKKYAVKDVVAGMEYEFRVTAINLSGAGEFSSPSDFVFARDPKKPPGKVTGLKVTETSYNHLVLTWTKPEDKPGIQDEARGYFVEIRRADCIEWSRCNSTPIIMTSFSVKGLKSMDMYWVRVIAINDGGESEPEELPNYVLAMPSPVKLFADDPKPPGPVELEENVSGTVTVIWEPSPDEKRDDRLHYTVSKLDCTKRSWVTVADRLFNNKFTVCNIMHGREYHFRVYAKNDMGISAPSESPTWGVEKKKEKFLVSVPTMKDCDLRCAPSFIVPLKLHTAPKGYECYMSCAVKGNPKPRITWYRNHISLNTNTNYYISNTCGVCTMLILRVGPKDMGEYSVIAENSLGRDECSTILNVRGEKKIYWLYLQ
uniref:Immunoglobulin-like and fibronectin type III domain-containing protein 1-like n=1 Tax=Neolamprologus brichardi TaxID=32507 RepID=A0A3Q4H3K1_NEOBR